MSCFLTIRSTYDIDKKNSTILLKRNGGFASNPRLRNYNPTRQTTLALLGSQLVYKEQHEVNRDVRSSKLNKNMCD